ncbi:MAG: NfeD family protein [Planctomycetota bacterium]|jgi:membrane-bound serine protease (ClpP class)
MGYRRRIGWGLIALAVWSIALAVDDGQPTLEINWPDAPPGARLRDDGWFAPRQPTAPSPELPEEVTNAFIIPIKDVIRQSLSDAIQRKVVICKGKGAELVIFDIDTPGGSVAVMDEICQVISEDLADVTTVAYVGREAMSAGAIISLSCDVIIMREGTLIGDAMPIMIGPSGMQPLAKAERAKIESYMLGKVRLIAEQRGHNIALCEGMVSLGIEVWLVRHAETGELRLINPEDKTWRRQVRRAPGEDVDLDAGAAWVFVDTIDSEEQLVTLTAREAYGVGLCDLIVPDRQAALDHFNVTGEVHELMDTWSEQLVAFLTNPAITGLLLAGGVLCIYMEISSPGFGVAGTLAVVCFAVLFGSRYLTGLAEWWEMALVLVGVALLILEVAVIPGFGVAGVAGILCILVGLLAVMIPNAPDRAPIPRTSMDWDFLRGGFVALCMAAVLVAIGVVLIAKYLPRIPFLNRFMLATAETYTETTATADAPVNRIAPGDVGNVEGMCRPVGRVRFGEVLVDAVSEGEVIESGVAVRVVRRDGNRVVVERTGDA